MKVTHLNAAGAALLALISVSCVFENNAEDQQNPTHVVNPEDNSPPCVDCGLNNNVESLPTNPNVSNDIVPDEQPTLPANDTNEPVIPFADISVSTQSFNATVGVGETATFRVTVKNSNNRVIDNAIINAVSAPPIASLAFDINGSHCLQTPSSSCLLSIGESGAEVALLATSERVGAYVIKLQITTPQVESDNSNNRIDFALFAESPINTLPTVPTADLDVRWQDHRLSALRDTEIVANLLVTNRGPNVIDAADIEFELPDVSSLTVIKLPPNCRINELLRCTLRNVTSNETVPMALTFNGVVSGLHRITASEASPTLYRDTDASNNQSELQLLVAGRGIVSFDSKDPEIVLRSTLTSSDEVAISGGVSEPGAANLFDAELGMMPTNTANGVPGVHFSAQRVPGLAELPEGQLSIEVEREWLAVNMSGPYDPESIGFRPEALIPDYLLSYGQDVTSGGEIYKLYEPSLVIKPKKEFVYWSFSMDSRWIGMQYANNPIQSRFAKLTISWTRNQVAFYVDGLLAESRARLDTDSGQLRDIHIGNLLGRKANGFTNFAGRYFIRNLIVAKRPVELFQPKEFRHILNFGDSFAVNLPLATESPTYDKSLVNATIASLTNAGLTFGQYTVSSQGGHQIQDNMGLPLEEYRAAEIAKDPSIVVFLTGGNDVNDAFDESRFRADLMDHVEAFMGENGHTPTNVQYFVLTTTVYGRNPQDPRALKMAEIMRELPGTWNHKYPSRAGRVRVIDIWRLMGGTSLERTYFGIADVVHPSLKGWDFYGHHVYRELIDILFEQR